MRIVIQDQKQKCKSYNIISWFIFESPCLWLFIYLSRRRRSSSSHSQGGIWSVCVWAPTSCSSSASETHLSIPYVCHTWPVVLLLVPKKEERRTGLTGSSCWWWWYSANSTQSTSDLKEDEKSMWRVLYIELLLFAPIFFR